ncbi:ComEC/Rec2 family competence protein [Candidatus Peregrinibacteria bacterium]|nr:ComEC/Rec2 family competence protein [Candidatus Peregrinibacteria bacterium]
MGRFFYIITSLIGFLVGVGLYLVIQPSGVFILFACFCCLLIAPMLHRSGRGFGTALSGDRHAGLRGIVILFGASWRGLLSALSVFFLFVFLGLGRGILAEHHITPDKIDYYNGQRVEIEGVITETDVRREKSKYKISVDTLTSSNDLNSKTEEQNSKIESEITNQKSQIGGAVLITLSKYPQFHYGDRVKISGELVEPGEFEGFNYGDYLSRYGVYSVMYYPYAKVLDTGQGNFFWAGMSFLQNKFLGQINKLLPEPHASFEAGLLVGARKGIPDDLMTKFNITGLTHIIAISGYNITIIIVFVMWLLNGLPRRIGFGIAVGSIVLFTLFVGASPAVVRASIMGILGLIALNYGRQTNINLTILWTAFFMVLWNPKILWWDIGFQLSFAAVLGLIYVAPLFEKYSKKLPEAFGIREAIMMTMSAQVMALPIIIFNFERLSLIAPIANLFVVFAIPPAMLFGFIAVILSFFSHFLGLIPAYIAWGILSYIIKVIEVMSRIPYASIDISGMKIWMMFGYYILLIFILFVVYRRRN